ncbi:hypothetical protein BH23CYA1_BH23CYA1_13650 [soil metagenome]
MYGVDVAIDSFSTLLPGSTGSDHQRYAGRFVLLRIGENLSVEVFIPGPLVFKVVVYRVHLSFAHLP